MKQNEHITCRELIDFIADYLDCSLSPEMRHEFERHLAVCPSCVAYVSSYEMTIRLGKTTRKPTDEPASEQVPEGLVRAIRAARESVTKNRGSS